MAGKICSVCTREQTKKFSAKCEFCGGALVSPQNSEAQTKDKKCPFCAELIKAEAKKCKHCGEMLTDQVAQNNNTSPTIQSSPPTAAPGGGEVPGWLSLLILLAVAGVAGFFMLDAKGEIPWRKSTEQLQTEVKESIQGKMREDPKTASMEVVKVTLIHKAGNEYDGIVEANLRGKNGSFGVKVTYDGKTLMWETARGYLLNFL